MSDRIQLTDDERSLIRWSNSKRGFVARLTFCDDVTRRGVHHVRPLRSQAFTTRPAAERDAERLIDRDWYVGRTNRRAIVRDVEIVEVDALGNRITPQPKEQS